MSRLAKKPIMLPDGVTAHCEGGRVVVVGAKGKQEVPLLPEVEVKAGGKEIWVTPLSDARRARTNAGTMWSLTNNAVRGVTQGFAKTLEIQGVGYRAKMDGKVIELSLGFVNPVRYTPPEGVAIEVEKNIIKISGTNKEAIGQVAAHIRGLKKPEPYKGKGIRYAGEIVRIKAGKKAAGATGTAA